MHICIYIYMKIICIYIYVCVCVMDIHIYIWVNYNDLTATSLESWLIRDIIPKIAVFRLFHVNELLYFTIIYPDIL